MLSQFASLSHWPRTAETFSDENPEAATQVQFSNTCQKMVLIIYAQTTIPLH